MSAARFLVMISADRPARYTTPISLLVGGLLVGLSSLGFLQREGSGSLDWRAGLLEFENLTRGQFCSVRCVEVFGCLHIYARLGEESQSADGAANGARTMTLRLDPQDYVYPAGLLTFNTLICHELGLSIRLHELMVRISTALLYPLCFGSNAESPSLSGLNEHLVRHVCAFLPAAELLALDRCSRRAHAVASNPELWRALGVKDFNFNSKHLLFHNMAPVTSKRSYLACSRQLYSRRKVLSARAQESASDYPWPGGGNRLAFPPFPPLSGGGSFY